VARSQPEIGGVYSYSALPRRIGSPVVFPNPAKVSTLMKEFGKWLESAEPLPVDSFSAHFRLVAIYSPIRRRKWEDSAIANEPDSASRRVSARRSASCRSEKLSRCAGMRLLQEVMNRFLTFLYGRLDETLGEYLGVLGAD
jgi:hypothetical protein